MSQTMNRPVRAILASGAVLGLGAVVTLAWFSDSEFADATFGSSSFVVHSAPTAEGPWQSHPAEDPLEISLPQGESGVLTQGVPVQNDVWLRIDGSTEGALSVSAPQVENPGNLSDNIHVTLSAGECGAPSAEVLQDGALSGLADVEQAMTLSAGVAQAVCIQAELSDDVTVDAGESTGEVRWVFRIDEEVAE